MKNKLYLATAWAMCLALTSCAEKVPDSVYKITNALVSHDIDTIRKYSVFSDCEFIDNTMLKELFDSYSDSNVAQLYNYNSEVTKIVVKDNNYSVELKDGYDCYLNTETYKGNLVWNIDGSVLYNSNFSVLSGSEVKINGIDVDSKYISESDDTTDTYTIPVLPNLDNKLIISNSMFNTVTTVWNESSVDKGLVSFDVDEKEKNKILKTLKDYTNEFYKILENNNSSSNDISKFFSKEHKKSFLSKVYNDGKAMLKQDNSFTRYYDISTEYFEYVDEPEFIDNNTLSMKIRVISNWLVGDGSLKGRTENYPTITIIKEDNKWVIDDIDDMSFLTNLNYLEEVDE